MSPIRSKVDLVIKLQRPPVGSIIRDKDRRRFSRGMGLMIRDNPITSLMERGPTDWEEERKWQAERHANAQEWGNEWQPPKD